MNIHKRILLKKNNKAKNIKELQKQEKMVGSLIIIISIVIGILTAVLFIGLWEFVL